MHLLYLHPGLTNIKTTYIFCVTSLIYTFYYRRWNAFLANPPLRRPREANYPEVTPNFIIELRSKSNTALDIDRKMDLWMRGGAEGSRLMMMGILLLFMPLLIEYYLFR